MNARDVALRAVQAGFGYGCAVAVATIVTVVVLFLYFIVSRDGGWNSLTSFLTSLPLVLFYGGLFTFMTALPGFLGVLLLSVATSLRGWAFFAIAGALDVFPAWALFEVMGRPDHDEFGAMLFSDRSLISLPGGFLGGLTYWYVVWRRLRGAPTSLAPEGS